MSRKPIGWVVAIGDSYRCRPNKKGEMTGSFRKKSFYLFKSKREISKAVRLAEKKEGHRLTGFEAFEVY